MTRAEQDRASIHIGGKLREDREYKDIKDVGDAVEAVCNFEQIWRFYHPLDPSAQAIFHVVFDHYRAGSITSIGPVDRFFMAAVLDNASSVGDEGLPSIYRELLQKWEHINRPTVTYGRQLNLTQNKANLSDVEQIVNLVQKKLSQKSAKRNVDGLYSRQQKKLKQHNWCPLFNVSPGCSHPQAGQGCIDPHNKVWRHGCNIKLGNIYCSQNHPAFEHK